MHGSFERQSLVCFKAPIFSDYCEIEIVNERSRIRKKFKKHVFSFRNLNRFSEFTESGSKDISVSFKVLK
jgi:hypothetical protein